MSATLRLVYHPRHLRPGGTISGPAMFALCDVALYVAILGEIGRVELAVTTNVTINFLRKPAPADLIGKARLMKLGKRLAVGEVALYSEGESDMVAHAIGTYSIPGARRRCGIIIPHPARAQFSWRFRPSGVDITRLAPLEARLLK